MSLDDLAAYYSSRLETLETVSDLLYLEDEDRRDLLVDLNAVLAQIRVAHGEYKRETELWKKTMDHSQRVFQAIKALSSINNEALPKIPPLALKQEKPAAQVGKANSNPGVGPRPLPDITVTKATPVLEKVAYLTLPEFQSIPPYMKGRIKYENLNLVVDEMNEAILEKYKFLAKPLSSLKPVEKARRNLLKSQESKDLKGVRFVTADEMKNGKLLKVESNRRNYLQILRHLGKIREIRGSGSLVKYTPIMSEF